MKAIEDFKDELRILNASYLKHEDCGGFNVSKLGELASLFIKTCTDENITYQENDKTAINNMLLSIKNDCLEIRKKLTRIDLSTNEVRIHTIVDVTLINFFYYSERTLLTKKDIVLKAYEYKESKVKTLEIYERIQKWLFDELGFNNKEIKHKFGFVLNDPDSFNRFINKNRKLTFNHNQN